MTWISTRNEYDEIDQWFSNAFHGIDAWALGGSYSGYPRVDAIEDADKIVLEAELIGLEKSDVSVEIDDDVLTIRGGNRERPIPQHSRYIFQEIKRTSFERSWTLDPIIDRSKVTGVFENGKLTVTLPKSVEKTPAKIKVL
jgi:HSP20 family protein